MSRSMPFGLDRLAGVASIALCVSAVVAVPFEARGDDDRFVRAPRGVVDVRTGLTWSYGAPRFLAWESANAHCRAQGGAWRLPAVDELAAVVVPTRSGSESLAREVFGRAQGSAYWSSDARTRRDDAHRLAVDEDGSIDVVDTRSPLAVRCVREAR